MEEKTICRDCVFWEFQNGKGICRRNSPKPSIVESGKEYMLVLPSTLEEDGCFDGVSRS